MTYEKFDFNIESRRTTLLLRLSLKACYIYICFEMLKNRQHIFSSYDLNSCIYLLSLNPSLKKHVPFAMNTHIPLLKNQVLKEHKYKN